MVALLLGLEVWVVGAAVVRRRFFWLVVDSPALAVEGRKRVHGAPRSGEFLVVSAREIPVGSAARRGVHGAVGRALWLEGLVERVVVPWPGVVDHRVDFGDRFRVVRASARSLGAIGAQDLKELHKTVIPVVNATRASSASCNGGSPFRHLGGPFVQGRIALVHLWAWVVFFADNRFFVLFFNACGGILLTLVRHIVKLVMSFARVATQDASSIEAAFFVVFAVGNFGAFFAFRSGVGEPFDTPLIVRGQVENHILDCVKYFLKWIPVFLVSVSLEARSK